MHAASALRRTVLNHVSTYAIERVLIECNTSVMPSEKIASRMALCPIACDRECAGVLDVRNEWVEEGRDRLVRASDLRFGDEDAAAVHGDILLFKLAPGQAFRARFWVERGTGERHAKFCPVSVCFLRGSGGDGDGEKKKEGRETEREREEGLVDVVLEPIGTLPCAAIVQGAWDYLEGSFRKLASP